MSLSFGGEKARFGYFLTQRVQAGEVDGGPASCPQCARQCTSPELSDGLGPAGYGSDRCEECVLVALLEAGFEQVGGLEEDGGEDARVQAGEEVNYSFDQDLSDLRNFSLQCNGLRGLEPGGHGEVLTIRRRARLPAI